MFAANTLTAKEVWSCKRDEGRPLGAGDQAQAPNHCELLPSRAGVVSVAAKGGTRSRQVRSGKTSESEPLMTCRNSLDGVETRGKVVAPATSAGGALETGPSGTRLGGGVSPDQALLGNAGTCRPDGKGEARAKGPRKSRSTDAGHTATRSSRVVMRVRSSSTSEPRGRTTARTVFWFSLHVASRTAAP